MRAFTQIRRDPMRYLERVSREHGPMVQFPVPTPPSYLVSSVEGTRHVLVTNARNYDKKTLQYSALSLVTGDGLLTADSATWKGRRRILQPAFHHAALALVEQHVREAVQRLVHEWSSEAVVDIDEAMMHAALDVVGGALFGTDLTGDAADIAEATLSALDVVVARARMPLTAPSWVPTPNNIKLRRALRKLDSAVHQILRGRAGEIPERPRDMLDLLLAAHDDEVAHLDARAIRDEIVTFIVAGHETVASALTWAWHLLGQHPQAYQRLRDEVDALEGEPGMADLEQLPFTRAVFDEVMRLYPPAWLITRDAREADVIDGVSVPAGSLIIMSPWIVHRDAVWSDSEVFRPERFLEEVPRHAYIPFGAGPRLCIGRDMALLEGVLMLAGIVRAVDVAPIAAQVRAVPLVTIRPDKGLMARVSPRRA